MKPIDLTNVQESTEGDFPSLPAGAYPCIITEVTDVPDREYLTVLFDIVAGEHEGYFSTDFHKKRPFTHSMTFSYKQTAQGMLKGRLHIITDCNTGFDAEAAFKAGQEQMLVGKVCGVVFAEQEYFNKKTKDFEMGSPQPARLCRLTELEDNSDPKPVMMNEKRKVKALKDNGVVYNDAEAQSWLRRRAAGAFEQGAQKVQTTEGAVEVYNGDIPFVPGM